ncbi:hypothetical protein SCOCK_100156 [Actinacidiphila cocklensis]|uniref:Uncharacterized protein n=1 Tax=Actinacidiphila cocklensis TaxID=887465 RepID=A0A9W4DJC2_9ACTN|nr:hypothetical protein SCOCK_100156 [Actinacidiphila cocklensis]
MPGRLRGIARERHHGRAVGRQRRLQPDLARFLRSAMTPGSLRAPVSRGSIARWNFC